MCCELSVENMVKKLEIHAFKLLYPNKPRRFPSKPARFSSDYLRFIIPLLPSENYCYFYPRPPNAYSHQSQLT